MTKFANAQTDALKSNIEAAAKLSEVTLTSLERLTALNLAAARSFVEEGVALTQSYAKVKDADDLKTLTAPLGEKVSEQMMKYVRDVQEVSKDMQMMFAKIMNEQMSSLGDNVAAMAPVLDMVKKATQQVSDMTAAGVKAATEMTEKLSDSIEVKAKKTA
ncbi:phasin family protein [Azoarcus sp. L1K30]|uniref:phasin family protein n=1 Tax=Azoarcus sp. L1K30 TaxID=2820277 RepID=UPI001B815B84|nr:phasin family protein [Azoarcus sp. L1K30]MBR0567482.1 phasin family protein [Azoarcus sp. L1K30]